MLREASDEIVAKEGAEVKLAEGSRCVEDVSSCPSVPDCFLRINWGEAFGFQDQRQT